MSALLEHRLRWMRWDGPTTALEKEIVLSRRLKAHLFEFLELRKSGEMSIQQFAFEVEFVIWSFDCCGAAEAVRKAREAKDRRARKRGGYTHGKRKLTAESSG